MVSFFSKADSERMRGHRHELQQGKSWLEGSKQLFPMRGVKHWEMLPGEVVESACREIFKTQLEKLLCFDSGCGQKGTQNKYRTQNLFFA